jgi:hypothetical protein
MNDNYTTTGKNVNKDSISFDDIIKAWEKVEKLKINKFEMIDAIYCHEDSKNKMLERLNVMEWTEEYPNFLYGFNVIVSKSIPENKVYILMQDGSVKILDLE